MKNYFLVFIFILLSVSCSKADNPVRITLTQYGTPFAGVPDPCDAVIYQVNMRAFSSTRNFQRVICFSIFETQNFTN